jgi:uncharacterized protein YwgA
MNPVQFLISLIDANGGEVQGRTLLQKRAYFVSLLTNIEVNLGFDAHYYGPYSATVDGTVTEMKNLGLVEEASTGFGVVSGGFEMRRYDYRLTEDGKLLVERKRASDDYRKIKDALDRISAAGNPNYVELSIAAKAFFILRKNNTPMTTTQLVEAAKKFNWEINEASSQKAVQFLRNLNLAQDG